MIKFVRFAGTALAVGVLASQASAQSGPGRVTPLTGDGWSVEERGEAGGAAGYSVNLVYTAEDFAFSIGCSLGYGLYVSWRPQTALDGGLLVPVTFSIDGDFLFERDIANNDRKDYSWLDHGAGTDADKLVSGIWDVATGELVVQGGGVRSVIPFDEPTNEYWSEEILAACGLM